MNTNEIWQAVLGELELSISKPNFTTWFKQTFVSEVLGEEAVVCVPNTFTKAWLEKKYHSEILKALQNVTDRQVRRICYRVETRTVADARVAAQTTAKEIEECPVSIAPRHMPLTHEPNQGGLSPKYTFENYIVGKANELAHAAAQAVAQKLGTSYNPLFIYGGVGLGKTHLIQAIGHEARKQHPGVRVLYVSCERFTNDFIHAVRSGRGKEFKETYRNVDLFLVDDIQFITGKEGTQEEFFHTFNTLHQANKQIAISSDRPPKAIPALEQRLLSRFEWGMMADISNPDMETRAAIVDAKAREQNFRIPREIVLHLASTIHSNVRELEGALNKIIAYHRFKNIAPSLESVKPILAGFGQGGNRVSVTPRQLIQTAAQYFDITHEDLLGKSREKRLAHPRQIVMYIMREELRSSYPAIGHELGGRDHTTAMHAYEKISKGLEHDERLRQDVEALRQRVFMN